MNYRIKYMKPFYYLQEKGTFLWIFTWWDTLEFSRDLEYIEGLYKIKIS